MVTFRPNYLVFLRKKSKKDVSNRTLFLLSETLKVLQYIILETGGLTTGKLGNKHRRGIVSKYLTALIGCIVRADIEIDKSFLAEFSELNKKLNHVDEKLLCESQKTVLILVDIILEQLRLYKTSEKYRNRVTSFLNNLVL